MLSFTFKVLAALIGVSWRIFLVIGGLVLGSIMNAAWAFFTSSPARDESASASSISSAYDAHNAFHNGEIGAADLQHFSQTEE